MGTKFWLQKLKERDSLGDLEVSRGIILQWFLDKYGSHVEWIQLAK
jgi:hypothetical protein